MRFSTQLLDRRLCKDLQTGKMSSHGEDARIRHSKAARTPNGIQLYSQADVTGSDVGCLLLVMAKRVSLR